MTVNERETAMENLKVALQRCLDEGGIRIDTLTVEWIPVGTPEKPDKAIILGFELRGVHK